MLGANPVNAGRQPSECRALTQRMQGTNLVNAGH